MKLVDTILPVKPLLSNLCTASFLSANICLYIKRKLSIFLSVIVMTIIYSFYILITFFLTINRPDQKTTATNTCIISNEESAAASSTGGFGTYSPAA